MSASNFLARRTMRTIETSDIERIQHSVDKYKILDGVPNKDIN